MIMISKLSLFKFKVILPTVLIVIVALGRILKRKFAEYNFDLNYSLRLEYKDGVFEKTDNVFLQDGDLSLVGRI